MLTGFVHCQILACAGVQASMTAQSSITTVKINIQLSVRQAEGPKGLEIHRNPICVSPVTYPEANSSENQTCLPWDNILKQTMMKFLSAHWLSPFRKQHDFVGLCSTTSRAWPMPTAFTFTKVTRRTVTKWKWKELEQKDLKKKSLYCLTLLHRQIQFVTSLKHQYVSRAVICDIRY